MDHQAILLLSFSLVLHLHLCLRFSVTVPPSLCYRIRLRFSSLCYCIPMCTHGNKHRELKYGSGQGLLEKKIEEIWEFARSEKQIWHILLLSIPLSPYILYLSLFFSFPFSSASPTCTKLLPSMWVIFLVLSVVFSVFWLMTSLQKETFYCLP